MPFELTQHPGHFRLRVHGVVTAQDFAAAMPQIVALERAHPQGIDRLVDLRDVTSFNVQYADVSDFAGLRRQERLPRRARSAIIAGRPVAVGFANMYATILNHPDVDVRVFQTEEDALAWLAEERP